MNIFRELSAKPWVAEQGKLDDLYAGGASLGLEKKTALMVFLAVVGVLFMLMVVAYGGRMTFGDWRPAPQVKLLWANTIVLILSSVALQWARYSIARGQLDSMRLGLLGAGALTVVFLFGQLLAWRQLGRMVYFDVTSPAVGFFYMITGIHGVHLLGGLVAWGRTAARVWGKFDVAKVRQSVELCAVYWHFLLLVWLILFGLLFTGNNMDLLLKLCGLK